MSVEIDAIKTIAEYWKDNINPPNENTLSGEQICIDYPDVDKMPKPVMVYLVPENGTNEFLTSQSVLETLTVTGYILAKYDSAHKTMQSLVEEVFEYYSNIVYLMVLDSTFGGEFIGCKIVSFDFYPAVSDLANSVGIEIKIEIKIERSI